MQTPIRYYITKADDQPVVRTVPVTVRPIEYAEPRANGVAAPASEPREARAQEANGVRRLVRSAMGRR